MEMEPSTTPGWDFGFDCLTCMLAAPFRRSTKTTTATTAATAPRTGGAGNDVGGGGGGGGGFAHGKRMMSCVYLAERERCDGTFQVFHNVTFPRTFPTHTARQEEQEEKRRITLGFL